MKQGALVSTPYNTIDFVRTMEEVLGLPPMNLNDALARPMADIFNTDLVTAAEPWSFTAAPSAILYSTSLPLPPKPAGLIVPKATHNAKYWARVTKGMDFTTEDRLDPADFNRILWKGHDGQQALSRQRRPDWTCARTARISSRATGDLRSKSQRGRRSRTRTEWLRYCL